MSNLTNNTTQLEALLAKVNALPNAGSGGGAELPTLTNPANVSDILSGKEVIDSLGKVLTGTIETFDGSYECSGESTGGGSIEAWTGTVYGIEGKLGDYPDIHYYYTDETFTPKEIAVPKTEFTTITILANSYIVAINDYSELGWYEKPTYIAILNNLYVFRPTQDNFEFHYSE